MALSLPFIFVFLFSVLHILSLSQILGTLAELHGNILFEENRHDPEGFSGALYLSSFAQIVLTAQTNITFINNNGRSV